MAASIVVGEAFLLWAIPSMGIGYLPVLGFLAAAIAIIPYREYRSIQRAALGTRNSPAPELVASKLRSLRPQFRAYALLLLGLALAAVIGLFLLPGSLVDRILPASVLLLGIAFFTSRLLMERRMVTGYEATLARIVGFEHRRRRGRAAIYEYKSSAGFTVTGKGGSLPGFSVGMTVPIFYNVSKPDESLPVTDFIFYRIRAELP